ncbi:cytochrome P450 [Gigaspora margarita]|uniref:Cytochrome P450 n=1 Tax=Gigaspora margarita TaxID=4874 RepID=A0A8H4EGM8_GIGMA|nr:cytochrome P450 [Gigaspora margarita]
MFGDKYIKKEDLMKYFLNDSDYVPNDVNDDYMEFLFEQLIVALFVEFLRQSKLLWKSFMFYFCYKIATRWNPELKKDIYEEQVMNYNKTNGNLTADDINKMAKLDDLLKETLRHSFLGKYFLLDKLCIYKYIKKILLHVVLKTTMSNYSYTFCTCATIPKILFTFKNVKHACPGRIFAATEIKVMLV